MEAITPEQYQLYEFILEYHKRKGIYPSMREMGEKMDCTAKMIQERIKALEKHKYLRIIRNSNGRAIHRAYELLVKP